MKRQKVTKIESWGNKPKIELWSWCQHLGLEIVSMNDSQDIPTSHVAFISAVEGNVLVSAIYVLCPAQVVCTTYAP